MNKQPDAFSALRGSPTRFLTSAWPWRSVAYLASTVPIGIGLMVVLVLVLGLGVATAVIGVGLLILAGVPLMTTVVAEVERARLGLVAPAPTSSPTPLRERLQTWRRLPLSWSEMGYSVALGSVLWVVDLLVVVVALGVPAGLVASPALVDQDAMEVLGWRIDSAGEAWPAVVVGLVLLVPALYVVTAVACAQAAFTRLLLDPPEARLVEAVQDLHRSRAGLVDAFEVERRRIERDLHDGAQQRLVALTMSLGQAELDLQDGPALEHVTRAHALAEEALEELRATVRGIHPQVLTDHGLEAAVTELAGRSPVPVTSDLHVDARLAPAVETAAYFVVSEALTNVARHSGADAAQVHGSVVDGVLTVAVVDDGRGGADPG
ncbi:MAG: sensor histidine kinase, partial [Actinomycetales bacterium]